MIQGIRSAASVVVLATLLSGCGGGSGAAGNGDPIVLPPPPNRPPTVRTPNPDLLFVQNHSFVYDALQNGRTFSDPDGDPLTITVQILNPPLGMTVSGTQIIGPGTDPGFVVIEISAQDNTFDAVKDAFEIRINPNSVPTVVRPNPHLLVSAGASINLDASQGGTTFVDADGDPLTYQMSILGSAHALTLTDSHVVGTMPGVGLVRVKITASDAFGGVGENEFSIAVPAPIAARPVLPAVSYIYADEELPLPYIFREMRTFGPPFMDTTPPDNSTTDAGATLGRVLFYDKRLSITNTFACASCHKQSLAFGSPDRFSVGAIGIPLTRHAMALANSRYNRNNSYFSDMRVLGIENLVPMPIEGPQELGNPMELLVPKLSAVDFYPPLFNAAFGTPEINRDRIVKALAQFVRSLISYNSNFDHAHYGPDVGPYPNPTYEMTPQELQGFDVFIFSKCGFCHQLASFTSPSPANNGLDDTITDPGTREGLGWFRAGSLRNITVSAPYMHDGRFATLREVVDHYDHGIKMNPGLSGLLQFSGAPTRLDLSEDDKLALEAFLATFTDQEFLVDPKFSNPFPP